MKRSMAVAVVLAVFGTARVPRGEAAPYAARWFYSAHNLIVDQQVNDLLGLIQKAQRSGYNGVVLADYKLGLLDTMPPSYFRNVARVRQAAAAAGMEVIPALFPVGYSNSILAHDPNLAEGLPVKAAPFVVHNGEAVPDPDAAPRVANAGFEQANGDAFPGFVLQDGPGRITFADTNVVHGGRVSCRLQDAGRLGTEGMARLAQRIRVRPFACYRLSCWVKTQDLQPANAFSLTVKRTSRPNDSLSYYGSKVQTTQDWTRAEVVFNSLEEREIQVYAGVWHQRGGTLWMDDLSLEEVPLTNILRRRGCPLRVTSEDGRVVYTEGRDFAAVRDPKLGRQPYPGDYSFDHAGPGLKLTAGSRIREGQRLRVSWFHPLVTGSQVMCCLTDAKVYSLLRDQARRVNEVFHPKTFFMKHDEVRVINWCDDCRSAHKTPGQLLADNARRCVQILKEVNPRARVVVWSDMFDPRQNAVDRYYLCNGSLKASWAGLPQAVIVADWRDGNWKPGDGRAGLEWFANLGHAQLIAGYYDSPGLTNFEQWQQASAGVRGITGFMYTTFRNDYRQLEAYGRAVAAKN
jgi:hypothetical protein